MSDPRSSRFDRAIAALDAANAEDPNEIEFQGTRRPKELLHAERASHWLEQLDPNAGELLRLAVRAHHLRRWQLPRSSHPEGRAGYHAWRRALQARHADEAAAILAANGYAAAERERVGELIRKRGLGRDPEAQTFEDVLCLVFIETQLVDFASLHDEDKVVGIVARSLAKMSDAGRQAASALAQVEPARSLVERAVARMTNDSG